MIRKSPTPLLKPAGPTPDPAGIVRRSPKGRLYRTFEIPLSELPAFLAARGLEPKAWFEYPPEGGWVLGVRPKEIIDENQI